jgi:predicted nuclease of predicted toxin-antitoxin system
VHVLDVELARVNDLAIWAYAAQHRYTIISKDADFADLALLAQAKVQVIWVRIGNCRAFLLLEAFKNALTMLASECLLTPVRLERVGWSRGCASALVIAANMAIKGRSPSF